MSCCIGGVCIPYTAIVPLLLVGVKWIATQLAAIGIVPRAVADKLGLSQHNNKDDDCCSQDCTNHTSRTLLSTSSSSSLLDSPGESTVRHVESLEEWESLWKKSLMIDENNKRMLLVVKFTATWCKPCQVIAPVFGALSAKYSETAIFVEVDVDDVDEVAAQYKVSMMPTFVWLDASKANNNQEVGRMTGSNAAQLEMAMAKYCGEEEQQ